MKYTMSLLLVIVLCAFFYVREVHAQSADHVGEKIADFELKALQGETIKLYDVIKDKVSVIIFTATWCGDCRKLSEIMRAIVPEYREKGVNFCSLYIGQNKNLADKGNGKEGPIKLLDDKWKAFSALNLKSIPHVIIVDEKGIVRCEGHLLQKKKVVAEIEKVLERKAWPERAARE